MTDTIFSVHTTHAQAKNATACVIPFERRVTPEDRAEFIQGIQQWIANRRPEDAHTPDEIAAFKRDQRIDAHRKAIILNLSHYYRMHQRADCAPGVLTVMTLLSDNDKGGATISQPTLAALFNRSVSSIAEARKRLRDCGDLVTTRGRSAKTYPVIPRAVTQSYNHLTWVVAAACDEIMTGVNHPGSPYDLSGSDDAAKSSGRTPSFQRQDAKSSGESLSFDAANHRDDAPEIIRPVPMQIQRDNSKIEDTSLRSVSSAADSGASGDDKGVPDDKDLVWGPCLDWLAKKSGQPRKRLQSLMGKWLKVVTYAEMLATLRAAKKSQASDPISYVAAIVRDAERANHNVRRENGRILVFNGFETELKTLIKGRDLQLALTRLEGRIPIGVVGVELETKVRSGMAEMVAREEEQDRRYLSAKRDAPSSRGYAQGSTDFFEGAL